MSTIPLPALSIRPAAQPDVLGDVGKVMQLRALSGQVAQQQALYPGQQRAQQQALQSGDLDLQQKQIAVKDQQLLSDIYKNHVTRDDSGSSDGARPQPSGVDWGGIYQDAITKGVSPSGLSTIIAAQKNQLDISDKIATLDKTQREKIQSNNQAVWSAAETLRQIPEGSPERATAYASSVANLQQQGVDTSKFPQQVPDNKMLDQIEAPLGMVNGAVKLATERADLLSKQQTSDPVLKLSQPEELSKPGAQASIQALIADPKTDPRDIGRLQALLPKAKVAQSAQLTFERSKKEMDQSIQDGDPVAAAKLLISGTVAPSQLVSSRKPEFAQKAFSAAAQLQPGWNAQKADADFKVASSPAQVAFFGSAKSLTDPGGTLDQLKAAGKDIPDNQFPVFNTVADALKASTGSGPIAKYASIALGVADDYSKVMGGGAGSDTSRTQALNLISAKQSPAQRAASIEGIRGSVGSQAKSRIGNNAVLQRMYGGEAAASASGAIVVTAPDGSKHPFDTQAQADRFKQLANIK